MPYANNHGIRLHYHIEGDGPPLLLHPGFSGSLVEWIDFGYVAALQNHYRLILLDPRGQGHSDKPHDPAAYTRRHQVEDVLAVLDALGLDRVQFWGYSMGGWVGFALGVLAPDRLDGLIIGGAHPFLNNPRPADDDPWIVALRQGMATLGASWDDGRADYWLSPEEHARFLANDSDALAALLTTKLTEPDLTDAEVASIMVPTLLYVGTQDNPHLVERAARLMPTATVVTIDGLDHEQGFLRSDLVVPHVRSFLERVDAGSTG